MTNEIFPAELVIKSLRDSGYKNAAYAIAELVDNSVQADASVINIFLCESMANSGKKNLEYIFVADNGKGMGSDDLVKALRFGDGSRLKKDQWTGIGKFGMGLPSASISQCKKVEVWSRKKDSDEILYTYLDIEEVREGVMKSIPKPISKKFPTFMPPTDLLKKSGTIVLWSSLDKCTWKTAKALHSNSSFLLGRIYRYFLNDERVKINFIYYDINEKKITKEEKLIKNDPMYLMSNTLCPAPFNDKPMFQLWETSGGDGRGVKKYEIEVDGIKSNVILKFSVAKKEARELPEGGNAGSTNYGKDARKNQGVSLVRNERELELDTTFVQTTDPTERWWGVELTFDASLDDVFGVTNNKQHARNFSEMQNHRFLDLQDTYGSVEKVESELKALGDPTWVLFRVIHDIQNGLKQIRRELENQTKGTRSISKPDSKKGKPEQILTKKSDERSETKESGTDKEKQNSIEQRELDLYKTLKNTGHDEGISKELSKLIISSGTRYNFEELDMQSPAFFDVRSGGSINLITINTSHPFYKYLYKQVVNEDLENLSEDDLKRRIELSSLALKILIGSWARMEDEANDKVRIQLQDLRFEWGKLARDFLKIEE